MALFTVIAAACLAIYAFIRWDSRGVLVDVDLGTAMTAARISERWRDRQTGRNHYVPKLRTVGEPRAMKKRYR